MNIPEWITLCAPFFVCAAVGAGVSVKRERRVSRETLIDALAAFGGIVFIGLNKEIFSVRTHCFFTEYADHFCVAPISIAAVNLSLAALGLAPWRSFAKCLAFAFCFGVFIEFVYTRFNPAHIGGSWYDIGLYCAGGAATALAYRLLLRKRR